MLCSLKLIFGNPKKNIKPATSILFLLTIDLLEHNNNTRFGGNEVLLELSLLQISRIVCPTEFARLNRKYVTLFSY